MSALLVGDPTYPTESFGRNGSGLEMGDQRGRVGRVGEELLDVFPGPPKRLTHRDPL